MGKRGWAATVAMGVLTSGALGCTSVRMVQREGCWVRQTERWIIGTKEDMGPCQRPEQTWSEDPLTRLVQECVAQADYRWQARALAAWNKGEAIPSQEPDEWVLKACTSEPLRSVLDENQALRAQLESLRADREALAEQTATDRDFMRASHDRLTDALGLAAQKEPGAAIATSTSTSTSEGTSSTTGELASSSVQESRDERTRTDSSSRPTPKPAPSKRLELMKNDRTPQACPPPAQAQSKPGPRIIPVTAPAPSLETPPSGLPVDTAVPPRVLDGGTGESRDHARVVSTTPLPKAPDANAAGASEVAQEGEPSTSQAAKDEADETATGGSGCPAPGE